VLTKDRARPPAEVLPDHHLEPRNWLDRLLRDVNLPVEILQHRLAVAPRRHPVEHVRVDPGLRFALDRVLVVRQIANLLQEFQVLSRGFGL
jgi:hypothetical protein